MFVNTQKPQVYAVFRKGLFSAQFSFWFTLMICFKGFYWPKARRKRCTKVWSDISVYNTINRAEIRRSCRWYTILAFFLVCAWLYKFVVWMLTVYLSEMSVLCECEIVLVRSDWRRPGVCEVLVPCEVEVWSVGVKFGTCERFGGVGICERGREKNGRMCVVWLRKKACAN